MTCQILVDHHPHKEQFMLLSKGQSSGSGRGITEDILQKPQQKQVIWGVHQDPYELSVIEPFICVLKLVEDSFLQ